MLAQPSGLGGFGGLRCPERLPAGSPRFAGFKKQHGQIFHDPDEYDELIG